MCSEETNFFSLSSCSLVCKAGVSWKSSITNVPLSSFTETKVYAYFVPVTGKVVNSFREALFMFMIIFGVQKVLGEIGRAYTIM